jgi:hypothetical protein
MGDVGRRQLDDFGVYILFFLSFFSGGWKSVGKVSVRLDGAVCSIERYAWLVGFLFNLLFALNIY